MFGAVLCPQALSFAGDSCLLPASSRARHQVPCGGPGSHLVGWTPVPSHLPAGHPSAGPNPPSPGCITVCGHSAALSLLPPGAQEDPGWASGQHKDCSVTGHDQFFSRCWGQKKEECMVPATQGFPPTSCPERHGGSRSVWKCSGEGGGCGHREGHLPCPEHPRVKPEVTVGVPALQGPHCAPQAQCTSGPGTADICPRESEKWAVRPAGRWFFITRQARHWPTSATDSHSEQTHLPPAWLSALLLIRGLL